MPAARAKTGSAPRRAPKAPARPVVEAPEELLERIFAGLPEPFRKHGPEVVRRNRRNRAKQRLVEALEARGPYPLTETLRVDLERTAKRWAEKDFADGFVEAEELEVRCAEEGEVLAAAASGDEDERFRLAERFHRQRVVKRYGRLEVRGLQAATRQDLAEAYVPLMVEEAPKVRAKNGTTKGWVVSLGRPRVPATDAVAKHARLLIVGAPGSGKSTLAAYLATMAARSEEGAIPFVVPVRSLAGAVTVESLAGAAEAQPWFLEAALEAGRALLLVDGLDEARTEVAGKVMPALREVLGAHGDNRVVATSRLVGKEGAAPEGFAQVTLAPMTEVEVDSFIEKWCREAEVSLGKAEADAKAAATDLKHLVRSRSAIAKLAQTPLLCSALCFARHSHGQVPLHRTSLYEVIIDALLSKRDRTRFPEGVAPGKLNASAEKKLLAGLACAMHEDGQIEVSEAYVVGRFEHLPDFREQLREILDHSGVLVERAPDRFGFAHVSLQEYLTALKMVEEGWYAKLLADYWHEWWHEVIVLATGIPGADVERIVLQLLAQDGEDVEVGTMLAAQCVEVAGIVPAALRAKVEERIAMVVPPRSWANAVHLANLGPACGPVLMRELARASNDEKAIIIVTLGWIGYEPALGTVARCLSDASEVHGLDDLESWKGTPVRVTSVAVAAAIAVTDFVLHSEYAIGGLAGGMRGAHPDAIKTLRLLAGWDVPERVRAQLLELIRHHERAHLRATSSAARPPKRAARSG